SFVVVCLGVMSRVLSIVHFLLFFSFLSVFIYYYDDQWVLRVIISLIPSWFYTWLLFFLLATGKNGFGLFWSCLAGFQGLAYTGLFWVVNSTLNLMQPFLLENILLSAFEIVNLSKRVNELW